MSRKNTIDPKLLEILVCPVSRKPLRWDEKNAELVSKEGGLAYPVREGIPVLLETEARKLEKS